MLFFVLSCYDEEYYSRVLYDDKSLVLVLLQSTVVVKVSDVKVERLGSSQPKTLGVAKGVKSRIFTDHFMSQRGIDN